MEVFHFAIPQYSKWLEKNHFLKYLDEVEQKRVLRLYQDKHKLAKLYSLLFQRYILSKKLNISPKHLTYTFNEKGKPFLQNHPLYFNLSNSDTHIVMVTDSRDIGIDIESQRDIELDIAERFFSQAETTDIFRSHSPKERFFEYWTLKEAFLKCIGTGLSKPLNSFTTHQTSPIHYELIENFQTYYLYQTYLEEHIPLSLCSILPIPSVTITHVYQENIENFFLQNNIRG